MKKIFLRDDFSRLWRKLEHGENFALIRHGDGERAVMEGRALKVARDRWETPARLTSLGQACLDALLIERADFIYGISCPCCDPDAYIWYLGKIKSGNLTFANMWINGNYQRFIKNLNKLERKAIVIANERGRGKPIGGLNILDFFPVSDNCVSFWEDKAPAMLAGIKGKWGGTNDIVYVVAAGPMAGPIIADLYQNNPNNTYIDFGSSIDVYLYGEGSRSYAHKTSVTANKNCWMYRPADLVLSNNKLKKSIEIENAIFNKKVFMKRLFYRLVKKLLRFGGGL